MISLTYIILWLHGALSAETSQDKAKAQQETRLLSAALSDLEIRGTWNADKEIMHYLDGFVGPIQWMIADSLLTAPDRKKGQSIHEYRDDVRYFRSMLKDHVTNYALPPPHRRSDSQEVSEEKEKIFEEYVALRDECSKTIGHIGMRVGASYCRDNQDWNLLMEHIGVMLGYPGCALAETHYTDNDPKEWQLALEGAKEKWKSIKKGEAIHESNEIYVIDEAHKQFVWNFPKRLTAFTKKCGLNK